MRIADNLYMTREGFCDILWNDLLTDEEIARKAERTTSPFTDTNSISVKAMWLMGIIKGAGDKKFVPEETITLEQCAVLMYRAALYLNAKVPAVTDEQLFADERDISDWAYESVAAMYLMKIIAVSADKTICPDFVLSAEEGKILVGRLKTRVAEQGGALQGEFTSDLLKIVSECAKSNYCISPYSIKLALALAANGANGETYDELAAVLNIEGIGEFNDSVKAMTDTYGAGKSLILKIANSIWLNNDNSADCKFKKDYKDLTAKYFGASSGVVDNSNAVEKINKWTAEHTNNLIKEIISDSDFGAALVNAMYFKGAWAVQFDEKLTKKGDFENSDGSKTELNFMNNTGKYNYWESPEGARVLELPYMSFDYSDKNDSGESKSVSMYIILDGKIEEAETLINEAKFAETNVELSLPRFRFETEADMTNILKNLGINAAFDKDKADFSNMFDGGNMYITDVLHKTYIEVNEFGTEAAAVTAVIMKLTSALITETVEFNANKPFIYIIRENTSGELFFAGEFRDA